MLLKVRAILRANFLIRCITNRLQGEFFAIS